MSTDRKEPGPAAPLPGDGGPAGAAPPPPADAPAKPGLTPEEQMKLFEKELKENDWGHQPC